MTAARVLVSTELLRLILHLPEDASIVGASMSEAGDLQLVVAHDDLVDSPVEALPMACPKFTKTASGEILMVSWGQSC